MVKAYEFIIAFTLLNLVFTYRTDSAKRRVIIEDHTSTRCGWCPIGTEVLKDNIAKFGDWVIPLQIHSYDNMATDIASVQIDLEEKIRFNPSHPKGYSSEGSLYPNVNGSINRYPYDGFRVAVRPERWVSDMQNILAEETPIDISVIWSIDGNILNATVTATVDEDFDKQLKLNLVVVEDGLSGSGTGWDQLNYLSRNEKYRNNSHYKTVAWSCLILNYFVFYQYGNKSAIDLRG